MAEIVYDGEQRILIIFPTEDESPKVEKYLATWREQYRAPMEYRTLKPKGAGPVKVLRIAVEQGTRPYQGILDEIGETFGRPTRIAAATVPPVVWTAIQKLPPIPQAYHHA
ncbi:hypothetical protein HYW30_01975 [Candidatus Azambacteria bacterium]|nr:hypothetical protein [Candidatus Azambacteria bacterium]MBI2588045.1 hypothetical protein [Candidatus Azambacteria bacterium]